MIARSICCHIRFDAYDNDSGNAKAKVMAKFQRKTVEKRKDYTGLYARQLGGKRVFVVTDRGLEQAGWAHRLFEVLESSGLGWVCYDRVSSNSRDTEVHEGAKLYREEGADVIVALGGGSSMDTAKGVASVVLSLKSFDTFSKDIILFIFSLI